METRILIPEPLSVLTSPSNSYTNLKEKKSKRNFQDEKKDEIQKPTSSSGLIEEEEEDQQDSDDNNSDSSTTSEELASVDNSSCGSESNNSKSSESIVSSVNRKSNKRQKSANKKCSQSKEQEKKDNSDNEIVSSADTKSKFHLNSYYSKYSLQSEDILRKKPFVKICANQIIEKGTTFSPNDGEVRVAFLNKALSQFPPDDIRFVFGCFDRITEDPLDEDKEIRLCNWIRFVKRAKDKYQDGVNVLARFSDRQPIFELTQTLLPGTELFVFFDIESIAQMNDRASKEEKDARNLHKGPGGNKPDVPLDLSKAPLEKPKTKSGSALIHFKVFSSQSPVPSSEKHFSGKAKSPTIFSINNVLQPIKLFQPYSISHHSSAHSRSSREYSRTPPSNVSGGILNSNHHHHHNNSGLLATTPSSIGSSSPSATNSPTLRPILRTRGRERSLLPCDVCGKAFDRPSLLKRHMRTHTGEKPHICDVCSKGFSTSSSLNTHRRIHSGEKPHQCPICGKRFTASSNLYYHRMTHNKEKPHKCLLCGKSFPTPGDLKSHQYVHSGSWPFNCPICHRGFSKQTNLRNHLLLHSGTGDKPHNCQICGKKFALACNLRAHLRTHEEDPISSCISCKRTFLSSLNMLVNGQCRSCILHQNVNVNTNINITTNNNNNSSNQADISKSKNSGGINLELVPVSNHNFTHSLTTSPSSLSATVSSDVSQSLGNLTALQVPTAAIAPLPGFLPTHPSPLFHGAITDGMSGFNRPNPFLEQLFEWNYRFAKETAGNLGLHFQQKVLESQMLAAQLMSVSNSQGMSNIGIGISDILRLRSQEFPTVDVASVNKFAQQ